MSIAYVTPRALLTDSAAAEAVAARWAWPLLGGRLAFAAMDVATRADGKLKQLGSIVRTAYDKDARGIAAPLRDAIERQLAVLGKAQGAFAGITQYPALMGVLNVTPDSFSDGGKHSAVDSAVAHGLALVEAGAALVDVGGESTRPGAAPVGEAEELARVVPVIQALTARRVSVSIDTRHAAVMREAVAAGARMINDVTALNGDPQSLGVVAHAGVPVVLMHMQGEPQTMQNNPAYVWAPGDIYDYLAARVEACVAAGIPKSNIAVDPGIGFGKTDVHNAALLNHLAMFHGLGCALVLGASRKGFIGRMSRGEAADARLGGSLAAALHGAGQGAQILRVHDVAETQQALAVAARLITGR